MGYEASDLDTLTPCHLDILKIGSRNPSSVTETESFALQALLYGLLQFC